MPPERWSAGIRFGTTEEEQAEGESLDQLLAEEEPDDTLDLTEAELSDDEEEEEEDATRTTTRATRTWTACCSTTAPTRRAGLVAEDEGAHPDQEEDLVAHDVGIDGGGATAEEAAMHVVEEDDYDVRSE